MKILAIKSTQTKLGKPMIIVDTAERTHWVPFGMWNNAGNSLNLESYLGGEFDADYFAKGEELLSGDVANEDGIILRSFSASKNPKVLAAMDALEIEAKTSSLNDAALLFKRKRAEATAKAAAEKAEAERLAAEAAKVAGGNVLQPEVTA